jgi:hypothetical protein
MALLPLGRCWYSNIYGIVKMRLIALLNCLIDCLILIVPNLIKGLIILLLNHIPK